MGLLGLILSVVAVVLIGLAAFGVGGRVSLALLGAACAVTVWLVLPAWAAAA